VKKSVHRLCIGVPAVALWALLLLAAGCSGASAPSGGSAGGSGAGTSNATGGSGTNEIGAGRSGTGGTSKGGTAAGGTGASASGTGGGGTSGAGANGTGGSASATSDSGTTGSSASDAGASATTPGDGGSGMSSGGGVPSTVELIGPGGATCGATNATHGDGFICVLNYPSPGANVVGYWFDYPFSANTCTVSFTKPAGNNASNPQVCFSGSACAATSGGGLGLALCDVHGIDVSTWPELMMLEGTSSLSSTAKSPFRGCNPGATMTSVNWTVGSGSIPAGTSVLFDDAADVNVARVDNLAAGATSVAVPANVDTSRVASIKFSVNGATSASWNFCLTSLKVSLH
jgi:hypothetical protein